MSKKETKDKSIEALLETEKRKNRRIVTGVLFAVGILIGTILGYFGTLEITSQTQAKVVNSIELKVPESK